MEVLRNLSDLLRKWRRRRRSDAEAWVKVWQTPYALAYAILYDAVDAEKAAEDVANKALLSLVGKVDRLRRRQNHRNSYAHTAGDGDGGTKFRKITLPNHLVLAESVFSLTTPKEIEIAERGDATLVGLDIWYIKHVIQHVLQFRNAFSACVGMSRGIHAYSGIETTFIWDKVVELAPRRLEQFGKYSQPFDTYWRNLRVALTERFSDLIKVDKKSGDIIRRPPEQQPWELVARYVQEFTMFGGDAPCGIESRDWTEEASDNIKAEERRLHTFLHRPCLQELIGLANNGGIPSLERTLGLPKYFQTMSSNKPETIDRTPPPLSEEKLNQKRKELEELLKLRGRATSDLVVAVDGVERERESASLGGVGRASFSAPSGAQAVEVWARRGRGEDVFLTSCPLSRGGRREVAELEGGQRLFFHVRYAEDESGSGAYEIHMRYQETRPSRRRALARNRRVVLKRPAGKARTALRWGLRTACAALLAAFLVGAVVRFLTTTGVFDKTPDTAASLKIHPVAENPSAVNNVAGTIVVPQTNPSPDTHDLPQPTGEPTPRPEPKNNRNGASPQTASVHPRGSKAKGMSQAVARGRLNAREHVPKTLAPIKTVFVARPDIFESASLNHAAYSAAVEQLRQSKLFRVVEDPKAAQAHLVFASGHRSPLKEKVQPQLVTARGEAVIWTGPALRLFDEDEAPDAREKAGDIGRRITDALIEKKKSELSSKRR